MNSSNQIQPIANENVLTEKEFQQLLEVDSPTVANIIELFNLRSRVAGFTNHTLKAIYPKLAPVVG